MAKAASGTNVVKFKSKRTKSERGTIDFPLMFAVLVLMVIGLVMLFSASSAANMDTGRVYAPTVKQAILGLAGIVVMLCIAMTDYKIIRQFSGILYVCGMIFMFIVPLIGVASHGATRQIDLKIITVQPSEFSKYFMIFWLATQFTMRKNEKIDTMSEFFGYLLWIIIPVAACFLQSHASAALLHIALGGTMILARGINKRLYKYIVPLAMAGIVAVAAAVVLFGGEYRVSRIKSYLGLLDDAQGADWQSMQSAYAVGSGGLFGLGMFNSRQKYSYLPEAENDYIFAIVAEEFGFVGAMLIILLFCFVVGRGIFIAIRCKDAFGAYLAFGISALIGLQVFINMGVVLEILPSTGMQLPLFSSGGTSLLAMLAGFGILLSVSRNQSGGGM